MLQAVQLIICYPKCSDHFEGKCFGPSWKFQNDLHYKDCQKRASAHTKEEVIYCFKKVVTGPQTTALLKKGLRHSFFSRILYKFPKFINLANIYNKNVTTKHEIFSQLKIKTTRT